MRANGPETPRVAGLLGRPRATKNSGPFGPLLKTFKTGKSQALAPPDMASGLVFRRFTISLFSAAI